MDEEIFVSCHAPSLSLLLYETARSVHDQKGLLIGQICNEVISRKTDENEVNREHKTAIYLEHCIPIEDQDVIGNAGLVNKTKLQKFIGILHNKIIGWYSFRRNSRLVPNSLSEMLIHQSLLELLPNTKCQYFIACFMSSNVAANMSTHVFNHLFMTFDPIRGRFEPLRLKIYTLSDKSVNSNGYVMKNMFPTSLNFNKIIDYVQKEETPVKSVLAIHEKVGKALKVIDKKLQKIETRKVKLEQEIELLKEKLATVNKEDDYLIPEVLVEEEPEREELLLKTVHFDPKVKYNSMRKVNPLKLMVPTEKQEEKHRRDPFSRTNKTPKHTPGKKSTNLLLTNCEVREVLDSNSSVHEETIIGPNNVPKSELPKFMDC